MIVTSWNKIKENLDLYHEPVKKYKSVVKKIPFSLKYQEHPEIEPSEAEKLIIAELTLLKIKFLREVSFGGFNTENGGSYRFDFFLPSYNLIIEYDGKEFHKDLTRDKIKNEFCKKYNITIIRLNSKHYFKMSETLKGIMGNYFKKSKPKSKKAKRKKTNL